ncbi:MAG: hypothetical protein IJ391_08365 [Clostridia bacterium]|nr:hypothetical protein [Clostridia bacterium]
MMTSKENYPGICVCCGQVIPEGDMLCPSCKDLEQDPKWSPMDPKENKALKQGLIRLVKIDFKRVFSKQTKNKKDDRSDKTGDK